MAKTSCVYENGVSADAGARRNAWISRKCPAVPNKPPQTISSTCVQGIMPWTHVLLIVCGGLFGTAGHFLLIHAFRRAPASALTPFSYTQLVFAMLGGWLVYRDFPNHYRILGMAVIAGSGLWMALHERRRARVAPIEALTVP